MAPRSDSFTILSLSGGGYFGLFTITLLADLEEALGAPIARHFDLIAGTSVGGIIALGLAQEIPARAMQSLRRRVSDLLTDVRHRKGLSARLPTSCAVYAKAKYRLIP